MNILSYIGITFLLLFSMRYLGSDLQSRHEVDKQMILIFKELDRSNYSNCESIMFIEIHARLDKSTYIVVLYSIDSLLSCISCMACSRLCWFSVSSTMSWEITLHCSLEPQRSESS